MNFMITLPQEVEQLARRLAAEKGVTVEALVAAILEKHAEDIAAPTPSGSSGRRQPDVRRMREIAHRAASRPVLDDRSAEEIVGFDEFGAPR